MSELLPCPLCGGDAKEQCSETICTNNGCAFHCYTTEWNRLPRRSETAAEVAREMDAWLPQDGENMPSGLHKTMNRWQSRLEQCAEAEPVPGKVWIQDHGDGYLATCDKPSDPDCWQLVPVHGAQSGGEYGNPCTECQYSELECTLDPNLHGPCSKFKRHEDTVKRLRRERDEANEQKLETARGMGGEINRLRRERDEARRDRDRCEKIYHDFFSEKCEAISRAEKAEAECERLRNVDANHRECLKRNDWIQAELTEVKGKLAGALTVAEVDRLLSRAKNTEAECERLREELQEYKYGADGWRKEAIERGKQLRDLKNGSAADLDRDSERNHSSACSGDLEASVARAENTEAECKRLRAKLDESDASVSELVERVKLLRVDLGDAEQGVQDAMKERNAALGRAEKAEAECERLLVFFASEDEKAVFERNRASLLATAKDSKTLPIGARFDALVKIVESLL